MIDNAQSRRRRLCTGDGGKGANYIAKHTLGVLLAGTFCVNYYHEKRSTISCYFCVIKITGVGERV